MSQSSLESKRAWAARNKHRINEINRKSRMRRDYGITPERFHEMYEEQDHRCAICKIEFASESDAHIDHCHETLWVRGLLCIKCNMAIGLFGDDVATLGAAIEYLATNTTPAGFIFERVPNPPRKGNGGAERTPEWRSRLSKAAKKRKING